MIPAWPFLTVYTSIVPLSRRNYKAVACLLNCDTLKTKFAQPTEKPVSPDPQLVRWVALSLIPNLGRRAITNLLDHFGTLDAIFAANADDLQAAPRIGPRLAAAIRSVDLERTRQEIAAWQADRITILLHADGTPYPAALAALSDAPPVLFQRGTIDAGDQRAAAVVGTRHPSAAARAIAATLGGTLVAQGWTVISGLAAGIDSAAHEGALRAGGRTIAVLGSGVRSIYPPTNEGLAAHVITRGALLSETHPDAAPNGPALVARNRLISGLSRALIVVEAGESSGSLHAARFARDQGRIVFAVDNGAPGNTRLIAAGARPLSPNPEHWKDLYTVLEHES
jgi:DNA processing protein